MAAKPTDSGRWGDVSADIEIPTSGKRDVGFAGAERPPAQYVNWFWNLVYLWLSWLDSLFTQGGGAVGTIDLGSSAEASIVPLAHYRDWNGKLRALVDHNGYRMGQVSEWDEHWRISAAADATDTTVTDGSTDPEGWTFVSSTTGTREYADPITSFPMRNVDLVVPTGALNSVTLTSEMIAFINDNVALCVEWSVRTGTVLDTTDAGFDVGILTATGGGAGAVFQFDNASGNFWETRFGGAPIVSSVAVTDNTVYTLRIEIIGATLHSGSNFLVRFYINGVLIRSGTSTMTANAVQFYCKLDNDNTGTGPFDVKVGRVRACWNHVLTADAL